MNMSRTLLAAMAVAMTLTTSCASYEKLIKKELKIPFVYMPPNDANHPYTLFMYTGEGNFQAVCDATRTTGLTKSELLEARQENATANFGISSSESVSVKVGLSAAETNANAEFSRINRVELSLVNGKVYTLPSISITDVVSNIKASSCGDDSSFFLAQNPEATFFIPTAVFGYDIGYRILTSDNTDVTAKLPPELTQMILTKVGVGYSKDSDISMVGEGLYVGFRGTSIADPRVTLGGESDIPASLEGHITAMEGLASREHAGLLVDGIQAISYGGSVAPQRLDVIDKLIDVTAIIREEAAD